MNQIELLEMMNMSNQDELMTLPGIGPVIAASIIDQRPYTELADTYRVTGINANFIDRLLELEDAVLSDVQGESTIEVVDQSDDINDETQAENNEPAGVLEAPEEPILLGPSPTMSPDKMLEPPAIELPPPPVVMDELSDQDPNLSQVSAVEIQEGETDKFSEEMNNSTPKKEGISTDDTRNLREDQPEKLSGAIPPEATANAKFEAKANLEGKLQEKIKIPFWKFLLGAIITALITISLTLAIMNALNGSLKYATSAQFRTSQREASQLNDQVIALQNDLDSLRSRVDILNGLNDRTITLEKSQKELSTSIEAVNQELSDLQDRITNLDDQLSLQEERTGKFEKFLHDLQALLGSLYAPEGASK